LVKEKEYYRLKLESDLRDSQEKSLYEKEYLKLVEQNYKQELAFLKAEKDAIVEKSNQFASHLASLQGDNEKKQKIIRGLKEELESLQKHARKMEKEMAKELEKRAAKETEEARDEGYKRGRQEAEEEKNEEQKKLMTIMRR